MLCYAMLYAMLGTTFAATVGLLCSLIRKLAAVTTGEEVQQSVTRLEP